MKKIDWRKVWIPVKKYARDNSHIHIYIPVVVMKQIQSVVEAQLRKKR